MGPWTIPDFRGPPFSLPPIFLYADGKGLRTSWGPWKFPGTILWPESPCMRCYSPQIDWFRLGVNFDFMTCSNISYFWLRFLFGWQQPGLNVTNHWSLAFEENFRWILAADTYRKVFAFIVKFRSWNTVFDKMTWEVKLGLKNDWIQFARIIPKVLGESGNSASNSSLVQIVISCKLSFTRSTCAYARTTPPLF
jgi:hypothetical protein